MKAPTMLPKRLSGIIQIVSGTSGNVSIAGGGSQNETASTTLNVPSGYTLCGIVGYEIGGPSYPAYAKVFRLWWGGNTAYARMNNTNTTNSCTVNVKFYGLCVKTELL